MKLLAKLLALVVGIVFVSAVWFALGQNLDSVQVKNEPEPVSKIDYQQIKYDNVQLPLDFIDEQNDRLEIRSVRPIDLVELKKIIYLESKILVLVDNAKLKNPFLGVLDKVLIQPIGFDGTHILTTGREVGQDSFKYVAEEFWQAVVDSGRKVWVLN